MKRPSITQPTHLELVAAVQKETESLALLSIQLSAMMIDYERQTAKLVNASRELTASIFTRDDPTRRQS